MLYGTVKFFNRDRGFGFIRRDDANLGVDVFFHVREVDGQRYLEQGEAVNFDTRPNARDGRTEAFNIRPTKRDIAA